jgi:hypothetical protein
LVKAELRPVFGDRLTMHVPPANPAERTRVNAMNSRLKSASGEIRLMVDPVKGAERGQGSGRRAAAQGW